jgi:hypothetical protein
MIDFGNMLKGLGDDPDLPARQLEDSAYRKSRALRVLVLKSWDIEELEFVLMDNYRSGDVVK